MSDNEQQPDVRWAFPPEKPQRGRTWMVVLLVVAVVAVAAVLAFFLIPRGDAPLPGASESPSASATPTPTKTPSPNPSASVVPTGVPSVPATTPPEPVDPDVDTFRALVGPRLDDALTGLSMLGNMSGQDAVSVIDQLQQDAQRLSDSIAPSSIDAEWRAGVSAYESSLTSLRASANAEEDLSAGIANSTNEVNALRAIVGL